MAKVKNLFQQTNGIGYYWMLNCLLVGTLLLNDVDKKHMSDWACNLLCHVLLWTLPDINNINNFLASTKLPTPINMSLVFLEVLMQNKRNLIVGWTLRSTPVEVIMRVGHFSFLLLSWTLLTPLWIEAWWELCRSSKHKYKTLLFGYIHNCFLSLHTYIRAYTLLLWELSLQLFS